MNTHTEPLALLQVTVDELALIKAQVAELSAREKALKALLTESGLGAIEGTLHRATVSWCPGRVTVDWETVARKFNPSHQLITAHTAQGEPFATVRVSARKGA